jgi:uncharacterized coiled-coil protein SlyX
MSEKIYLGKVRDDFKGTVSGEKIFLSKHSFDCGWYWGFGYIGNKNLHCHFDGAFLTGAPNTPKEIFDTCNFTECEWWVIRDLFIQAYALKDVAAVYRHGGHQTTKKGLTDIIHSSEMADRANKDLQTVLDTLWDYTNHAIKNQSVLREEIKQLEKEITFNEEKINKLNNDKSEKTQEINKRKDTLKKLKAGLKGV